MALIATALQDAATAEPITRTSEMPELASMALLSVVLAGVSMAVRRYSARSSRRQPAAAEPETEATPRARSSPSES